MKRGIGILLVLLLAGGLAFLALLPGGDGPAAVVNRTEDALRGLVGADRVEPGVVATVDGEPVYLRQVEALYDMNGPSFATAQAVTLDEVRADYADRLNTLIMQALIRKELKARGLSVDDAEVRRLEELVSTGYDEEPGPAFDRHIEEAGLSPAQWREQLRARLELELWQAQLARTSTVTAGEVEEYMRANPGVRLVPEQVDYLLVGGAKRAGAEAARKSGVAVPAELRALGLEVRRFRRPAGAVPDVWARDMADLAPGSASPVRQIGPGWRYVILLERLPARSLAPAEVYTQVEKLLMEQRLPELFDAWLSEAVAKADIRIAPPLLPRNVPKPAPRPAMSVPEQAEPAGTARSGADFSDAVGEVEADNQP